jgi:predicted Zn-dependent peptidase
MRNRLSLGALVTLLLTLAVPALAQDYPCEVVTLPNGLTVILHEDHTLPQVTINTWFGVGSRDEAEGRTGFAHLFEHLMFMGTTRVPQGQFDAIMEGGGGANNASTGADRTNYFSFGPSSLLPTLLWLDADRLEGLGKAMTKEKLDLQRSVVQNERRQGVENTPYGVVEVVLPTLLYPEGHPYAHPVIGSHEDLEAASLKHVVDFFNTYYVTGNATLVVAGDFRKDEVKPLLEKTFGAVPARYAPARRSAAPVKLSREVRSVLPDKVENPKLYLVWHSPAAYDPGDAEMDLAAAILAKGGAGRLHKRLVLTEGLASEVDVYQGSQDIISEFHIEVMAREGVELDRIKQVILEELEAFKKSGPTQEEVQRVKAGIETGILRSAESLVGRADMMNEFYLRFGEPNSFKRALARYNLVTPASVQKWASDVFSEGRLDLRVVPVKKGEKGEAASLDKRPADLVPSSAVPPAPEEFSLSNGLPVFFVRKPGCGLFGAIMLVDGGDRLVPAQKAGLGALTARLLTRGAAGKDASAFAEAAASLGATVRSSATWNGTTVSVTGLASRADAALDLFADAILRPEMTQGDFDREKGLQLQSVKSRKEEPRDVADVVQGVQTFAKDDPRGRALQGYESTVPTLTMEDVKALLPRLVNMANARIVAVGDLDSATLKAAMESRFGSWKGGEKPPELPKPETASKNVGLVLVDRPGAPQTYISLGRPVSFPDGEHRAVRECLATLFGGSFTSRLNQNLREKNGFTYGVGCGFGQEANQSLLQGGTAVQTEVTGAALSELKKEFDAMAGGDASPVEVEKAIKTQRFDLVTRAESASGLMFTLAAFLSQGRPPGSLAADLKALDKVTPAAANAEARSGSFKWSDLLIVLVGDKEAVTHQLEKAGFQKPRLADTEGNLLP